MLRDGRLNAGHARALITTDDPSELARRAVAKGLSVREVERLAKSDQSKEGRGGGKRTREKDADTRALEADLSAALGMSGPSTTTRRAEVENWSLNTMTWKDSTTLIRKLNIG
jgi:ParB-like chromosome segregation protein Spo0J